MPDAFTLIVNPAAGRGRARKLLPRLEAAIADGDGDFELHVSTHAEAPAALARAAIDRGRCVVACGGDGLVGQLAGVAAEADGVLGVVPMGAGNDFARHLGLDPGDPLAALTTLRAGVVRRVDLGRVDGRAFCCVAGTGFDAEANRWANSVHWLTGTALYVAAMLRTLATYRPRRFRITADGESREVEAWLVAVANAPSFGGGMLVVPHARTDDGELGGAVIGAISRLDFLRTFPKVFSGRHVEHPRVEVFSARRVELALADDGPPIEVYADGERVCELPVRVEVSPGALQVIAPPAASRAG
jgi:YegS/Rv2252/BmrU family lipid kinase